MNFKKIITLLLAFTLTLSLAACGSKGDGKGDGDAQGATAEEIYAQIQELADKENAIMEENLELWQKLFAAMNEKRDEIPDESNYGAYLLAALDLVKDQFTEEEYASLKADADKIREIENQITALPQDEAASQSAAENGSTFPQFEGKDLNGNPVKSDDLFSKNAVTVVNFWFTTCNPCVGELTELESLHQELTKKGGGVIGINSFTLGGDEAAISEAKSVLSKKGVTYPNVYFPAQGEAGKFVENVFAYPTTYVVDRSGNIVGDPIVGAITDKSQMESLNGLINKALSADKG